MSDLMFKACIKTLEKAHDNTDRLYSEIFAELPDRAMYADYYVLIKDPISFKEIKQRCADSKYKTFEDLAKDFRLMFKNAKTYNQEGSGVYQDAEDLEMLFVRAVALAKRGVKPSFKKIQNGGDDVEVGDATGTGGLADEADGAGTNNATGALRGVIAGEPLRMTDGEQGDAAAAKKRKLDSGAAVELSTPTPLDSENAAAANELDNENDEFVDEDESSEDEAAIARVQIPISSLHKTSHVGHSVIFMDRQEASMQWLRRAAGFRDIPIADPHR